VDPATRRVWRDEREIIFSRKEFDLLHFLMQRAGSVVSRDELMLTVWNTTFWTSSGSAASSATTPASPT
jgi:DNA-binding response OmpR family regulator